MLNFTEFLAVAGLFVLRIGVPLLIMVGLVYLLKRLDRRWEADARATQQRAQADRAAGGSAGRAAASTQAGHRRAGARATAAAPVASAARRGAAPCPAARPDGCAGAESVLGRQRVQRQPTAQCAAPKRPDVPCWQARFDAEGAIPEDCVKCESFQRYPMM